MSDLQNELQWNEIKLNENDEAESIKQITLENKAETLSAVLPSALPVLHYWNGKSAHVYMSVCV